MNEKEENNNDYILNDSLKYFHRLCKLRPMADTEGQKKIDDEIARVKERVQFNESLN